VIAIIVTITAIAFVIAIPTGCEKDKHGKAHKTRRIAMVNSSLVPAKQSQYSFKHWLFLQLHLVLTTGAGAAALARLADINVHAAEILNSKISGCRRPSQRRGFFQKKVGVADSSNKCSCLFSWRALV
jgi:hypothetical protein